MKNRIGEKHLTNEGYTIKIIEYLHCNSCTVQFEDGSIISNIFYSAITRGNVKNPYHPSVCGIGYLGQGIYTSKVNNKMTKCYYSWNNMINRSYNKTYQNKFPTYKGCIVAKKWYNFQNFAKWYEENYKSEFMESWHLDKDILVKGNKIYSPETCCFVPSEINTLFSSCNSNRGVLPIGVNKRGKRFISQINLDLNKKFLGLFNIPEEAFQAYKIAKESYIKETANKYKNQITPECYKALINYNVEITD